MKILISNGHIIDPANKIDGIFDILLEDEKIAKVAKGIKDKTDKQIDATGKIVIPGIVDMHVHLREPGREDKETIESGTIAALKGGVTSVLAMPNTHPCMDTAGAVQNLRSIITKTAKANVFIAGAITQGRAGKELTNIAELKKCGVVAISDDGASLDSEELLSEALQKARDQVLVICHCEDKSLSNAGVVNLGFTSTRLGLRGISCESEYKRIERDILIAEKNKTRIHIAHVSCKESVEIIAKAKEKGIKVTCETAPHYFSLTEEEVLDYDTNMKMNPPLRTKADKQAIIDGLKNGVIDVIASDHAPHTENEKQIEFDRAEFGVTGLETELAVSITGLVQSGILDWNQLVEKLALNPARILGIDKGSLSVGRIADLAIISPEKAWVVRKEDFASKSKNSSFIGKKLLGVVLYTICGGKIVYQNAEKL